MYFRSSISTCINTEPRVTSTNPMMRDLTLFIVRQSKYKVLTRTQKVDSTSPKLQIHRFRWQDLKTFNTKCVHTWMMPHCWERLQHFATLATWWTFCNPCNMVEILRHVFTGETATVSPPASETLHPLSVIEVEVDVKWCHNQSKGFCRTFADF